MRKDLKSFKVQRGKKILDYRVGGILDLKKIRDYFQNSYKVKKIWQGARHVLGILEKEDIEYFLKLSTSEGISEVTKNEHEWNDYFNLNYSGNDFVVPKNYQSGLYSKKYYYLITDYLNGQTLDDIKKHIPQIIKLSELIQELPEKESNFKKRFRAKVNMWYEDIPKGICRKYNLEILLKIVEKDMTQLSAKVRHGDFTPWHMIKMPDGKLGLIDGEHFLPNGVENYDICYFIQRIFSVLKKPDIAKIIYTELKKTGYNTGKLKVVLAARAIGGFLDESLGDNPNYKFAESFKDWIISL